MRTSDPLTTAAPGARPVRYGPLAARGAVGGALMGLANLVPGISGGTMLLAAGVYPRFVNAVAELSTLRFRRESVVLLAAVVLAAMLGVLLLAGFIKDLVVHQRWIMYSLFIGLTLGGVPLVWRLAGSTTRSFWVAAAVGFTAMGALAIAQQAGAGTSGSSQSGALMFVLAGLAGASAMILPGVSGGYVLLVLGMYIPVLSGIEALQLALTDLDLGAAVAPALQVVLPVGIGVVLGVVVVSRALRWLLARHTRPTLGVLLGLLVGAVMGLWPFQRPVEPVPGVSIVNGRIVTAETLPSIDVEDYPTRRFAPGPTQVAGSLGLVLAGASVTLLVARFGRDGER